MTNEKRQLQKKREKFIKRGPHFFNAPLPRGSVMKHREISFLFHLAKDLFGEATVGTSFSSPSSTVQQQQQQRSGTPALHPAGYNTRVKPIPSQ